MDILDLHDKLFGQYERRQKLFETAVKILYTDLRFNHELNAHPDIAPALRKCRQLELDAHSALASVLAVHPPSFPRGTDVPTSGRPSSVGQDDSLPSVPHPLIPASTPGRISDIRVGSMT